MRNEATEATMNHGCNKERREAMADKKRSRRSGEKEAKWEGLIREHRGSGETVRGFCRRKKETEASFHRWRRELKKRGAEAFVPVTVSDLGGGETENKIEAVRKTIALIKRMVAKAKGV